ncbi:MAG: hypothetical protein AB7U51_14770 [Arcobacter sp.]|jgi:hypothetical protein|uniref:hypothetical protein n=1 Tax=Arcobacter sp. TaxID=1872629 RepID=UPI003D06D8A7
MCDFYKKMNYLFFNLGKVLLFSSIIAFVMAIISLFIFSYETVTSQDIDEVMMYLTYLVLCLYLGFSLTIKYDDKFLD